MQVYDHTVGVVHYLYAATVSLNGDSHDIRRRWTEVYLKRDDEWLLIAVHGGPERRELRLQQMKPPTHFPCGWASTVLIPTRITNTASPCFSCFTFRLWQIRPKFGQCLP